MQMDTWHLISFADTKAGDEDVLHVAEESQNKIINILNGDDSQSIEHPLKYEDGYISIKRRISGLKSC